MSYGRDCTYRPARMSGVRPNPETLLCFCSLWFPFLLCLIALLLLNSWPWLRVGQLWKNSEGNTWLASISIESVCIVPNLTCTGNKGGTWTAMPEMGRRQGELTLNASKICNNGHYGHFLGLRWPQASIIQTVEQPFYFCL